MRFPNAKSLILQVWNTLTKTVTRDTWSASAFRSSIQSMGSSDFPGVIFFFRILNKRKFFPSFEVLVHMVSRQSVFSWNINTLKGSENEILLIYTSLLAHILPMRPERENICVAVSGNWLNLHRLSRGTACENRWILETEQIIFTRDIMSFGFYCEILLTNNSVCHKLFWPVATEIKLFFCKFLQVMLWLGRSVWITTEH